MSSERPLIITGSSGKIGRMLRAVWAQTPPPGLRPIWQVRRLTGLSDQVQWDILHEPPPDTLPRHAVILHLAGSTLRRDDALAAHVPLVRAVVAAATALGAVQVLHASSAAVYGVAPQDHSEDEAPDPQSAYGQAKAAAEAALSGPSVALRIGNIAGADALLGNPAAELVLDPVPGCAAGPVRSYIGPRTLAAVLARLAQQAAAGAALPRVLNIAQGPAVGMADLAQAAGRRWRWGPDNPQVIPRVGLGCARLAALLPGLPPATAAGLVAEGASLAGVWP